MINAPMVSVKFWTGSKQSLFEGNGLLMSASTEITLWGGGPGDCWQILSIFDHSMVSQRSRLCGRGGGGPKHYFEAFGYKTGLQQTNKNTVAQNLEGAWYLHSRLDQPLIMKLIKRNVMNYHAYILCSRRLDVGYYHDYRSPVCLQVPGSCTLISLDLNSRTSHVLTHNNPNNECSLDVPQRSYSYHSLDRRDAS